MDTPRTPPPFKGRTARLPTTPVTPFKFDPALTKAVPRGNFLIIRGVYNTGDKKINPVPIIQLKVAEIRTSNPAPSSPPTPVQNLVPTYSTTGSTHWPQPDGRYRGRHRSKGRTSGCGFGVAEVYEENQTEGAEDKKKNEKVITIIRKVFDNAGHQTINAFKSGTGIIVAFALPAHVDQAAHPPTPSALTGANSGSTASDRSKSPTHSRLPLAAPPVSTKPPCTTSADGSPPSNETGHPYSLKLVTPPYNGLRAPQLLFTLNTTASWRADPTAVITEGAAKTIDRESRTRNAEMKDCLVDIDKNITTVTNLAVSIGNRQEELGRGFLLAVDDSERTEIRDDVARLKRDRDAAQGQLDALHGNVPTLHPAGPVIPPPPHARPPPLFHLPRPASPSVPAPHPTTRPQAPTNAPGALTAPRMWWDSSLLSTKTRPCRRCMILIFVSLIHTAAAASAFSMYALNANGLVNSAKLHHISNVINARNPHAFTLSESKNEHQDRPQTFLTEITTSLRNLAYRWKTTTYTNGGSPSVSASLFKSPNEYSQHRPASQQRQQLHPPSYRTPATCDFGLSSPSSLYPPPPLGHSAATSMRPYQPQKDPQVVLTPAVNTSNSLSMSTASTYGETTPIEVSSATGPAVLTVARPRDFVPFTNHRAVIANIDYTNPSGSAHTIFPAFQPMFNKPRIKFPAGIEKHRHETFRTLMDERLAAIMLHEVAVTNDDSFLAVYNSFTTILIPAAEEAYGRVIRFTKRRDNNITTPLIENIIAQLRFVGGAIRANPPAHHLPLPWRPPRLHPPSSGIPCQPLPRPNNPPVRHTRQTKIIPSPLC
ncbi:hypothetical protein B0H14DRAFT_2581294 [Mycena olivaceomarginata]|nr:hypothetical protein B0H14DRAFT_2581294 [Mycena olivaceomarginata]